MLLASARAFRVGALLFKTQKFECLFQSALRSATSPAASAAVGRGSGRAPAVRAAHRIGFKPKTFYEGSSASALPSNDRIRPRMCTRDRLALGNRCLLRAG